MSRQIAETVHEDVDIFHRSGSAVVVDLNMLLFFFSVVLSSGKKSIDGAFLISWP